jgi:hypothetical protein
MAKVYTWNGETYNKIPNPLKLEDGTSISPVSEAAFIANGGSVEENGEPTHWEELDAACDVFIAVVLEIAETIGDPTFMGGINEQEKLLNSDYAKEHTTEALVLSERWNGANLACNHFANKPDVNMQSPAWYYYAWQRYAEQLEAKKGK